MAMTMKIAVFWDVNTAMSSINVLAFQRILLPLFSEQMKVHSLTPMMGATGPSEWQQTSTIPHGVTSQKDAVFKYLYFNTKNKNKCIQSTL